VALAPTAAPRLAMVWFENPLDAAAVGGARAADAGANVLALEPVDRFVFTGATNRAGLVHAAPSQVAADLLTSPGRGPAEADALIDWMLEYEEVWRA
jgi:hypothetical protein